MQGTRAFHLEQPLIGRGTQCDHAWRRARIPDCFFVYHCRSRSYPAVPMPRLEKEAPICTNRFQLFMLPPFPIPFCICPLNDLRVVVAAVTATLEADSAAARQTSAINAPFCSIRRGSPSRGLGATCKRRSKARMELPQRKIGPLDRAGTSSATYSNGSSFLLFQSKRRRFLRSRSMVGSFSAMFTDQRHAVTFTLQ